MVVDFGLVLLYSGRAAPVARNNVSKYAHDTSAVNAKDNIRGNVKKIETVRNPTKSVGLTCPAGTDTFWSCAAET